MGAAVRPHVGDRGRNAFEVSRWSQADEETSSVATSSKDASRQAQGLSSNGEKPLGARQFKESLSGTKKVD